jgi:plasmid stability protein
MIEEVVKFLKETYSSEKSEIDESKFIELIPEKYEGMIIAIDGGSGIIFDGGSSIVAKIKVGAIGYQNKKRVLDETKTYYLAVLDSKKGRLIKLFPEKKILVKKEEIEDIPNEARKILEKEMIAELSKKFPDAIILADGHQEIEGENVVSVCKTSRAKTKNGRSMIGELNEVGEKLMKNKGWFYQISEKEYVVKFHGASKFAYRVLLNTKKVKEVLSHIAYYSRDPEIIGYPYPLLKIDKIVRLRNDEKISENRNLKLSASKHGISLEHDETATLMHKLMDERMYR